VAGLVLLTFSVYHTSLSNGFVWDDHHLITMNPALTRENAISEAFLEDFWEAASQLRSDYYRPVIIVSYTVDHWFYGPDPWGYHLTNVLIHASTTVLLFILLTQLGLGVATAMAGAALFSCHPVLAESVAWISGRTDSTAAMLVLLCLVADTHSRRPQWAALTMAALIGALLAKEMAVIVPLLAVAAAFARGETLGHALRDRIYMLPVILGYFLVRFLVLGSPVAALVVHNQLPVASRLLFPLHLVGLLVLPFHARVDYVEGIPPQDLFPSAATGLVLILLLAFAGLRERSRCGSWVPLCLAGSGLVALIPSAGAILVKGAAADRLIYLPAVFLLPAIAMAIIRTFPVKVALPLLLATTVSASVWTVTKVPLWTSDTTLFESAINEPSPSVRAHLNLGGSYHGEGRLLESFDTMRETISLIDDVEASGVRLPFQRSIALSMSAIIYHSIDCDEQASRLFRASLKLDPMNVLAANNLSGLLASTGRFDEAEDVLMAALQFSSDPGLVAAITYLLSESPDESPRPLSTCGDAEEARAKLGDIAFLNRRTQSLLEDRQYGLAPVLMRAAIYLDREDSFTRLNEARFYAAAGDDETARSLLTDLLNSDRDTEVRALLGQLAEPK
jgi:tetratricopeptide (TPR) repeat protein